MHTQLGRHVDYDGTQEGFDAQYAEILLDVSASEKNAIHDELAAELLRRQTHFAESRRRKSHIAANYTPLHKEVYTLRDEFVDPRWRELVGMAREATASAAAAASEAVGAVGARAARAARAAGAASGAARAGAVSPKDILMTKAAGLLRQRPHGVFSFPALTPHFCRLLREEKEHFEKSGMPCVPPNTVGLHKLNAVGP
jgi:hypothetical protein